jgi:hypothetical protein
VANAEDVAAPSGVQEWRMQHIARQHRQAGSTILGRHLHNAGRHQVAMDSPRFYNGLHTQLDHIRLVMVADCFLTPRPGELQHGDVQKRRLEAVCPRGACVVATCGRSFAVGRQLETLTDNVDMAARLLPPLLPPLLLPSRLFLRMQSFLRRVSNAVMTVFRRSVKSLTTNVYTATLQTRSSPPACNSLRPHRSSDSKTVLNLSTRCKTVLGWPRHR